MFKQLLQADAIRLFQVDAARLGGVNEVLSADILPESLEQYRFPDGAAWRR